MHITAGRRLIVVLTPVTRVTLPGPTAQRAIMTRGLEARPGIGTVVPEKPAARVADRKRLLNQHVEQFVVEAKKVGVSLQKRRPIFEWRKAKLVAW
jgi:hypothetical protein